MDKGKLGFFKVEKKIDQGIITGKKQKAYRHGEDWTCTFKGVGTSYNTEDDTRVKGIRM